MKRTVFIKSTIKLETEEQDLEKLRVSLLGVSDKDYEVVMQGMKVLDEWNPDYPADEMHIKFLKQHIEELKAENQKFEQHMGIAVFMLQRLTKKLKEVV